MRRFALGLLRVVLWAAPVAVGTGGVLAVGLWGTLRSEHGNDWLLRTLLPHIQPAVGQITVGRLRSDLWRSIVLEDVVLTGPAGETLVRFERLEGDIDLTAIPDGALHLRRLQATGLLVDLADPTVFGSMWPSNGAPGRWKGLPIDVLADEARIRGTVRVGPWAIMGSDLRSDLTVRGPQVSLGDAHLTGFTSAGRLTLETSVIWSPSRTVVSSAVAAVDGQHDLFVIANGSLDDERVALSVAYVHLDPVALGALVPAAALPLRAPIEGSLRISGSRDMPAASGVLQSAGGVIAVGTSVTLASEAWRLSAVTPGFELSALLPMEPLRLGGMVRLEGTGWRWPEQLGAQGDVDLVVELQQERALLSGPVNLAGGILTVSGLNADIGWGTATASGFVDLVAAAAELDVDARRVDLHRFGQRGLAGFVGQVRASWGKHVDVRLNGRVNARAVAVQPLRLAYGAGPIDLRWDGRNGGQLTGDATLDLRGVEAAGRRAAVGRSRLRFGEAITFDVSLDHGDLAIAQGRYLIKRRSLDLITAELQLSDTVRAVTVGPQHLRIVNDGVAEVHVDVAVAEAHVRADGAFGSPGDSLAVVVRDADLKQLAQVMPGKFAGWSGKAEADVRLGGTARRPTLEGHAGVLDFSIPAQLDRADVSLTFDTNEEGITVNGVLSREEAVVATLVGSLPVRLDGTGAAALEDRDFAATLLIPDLDSESASALLAGRAIQEGHLRAALDVSGTLADPKGHLDAAVTWPGERNPGAEVVVDLLHGRIDATSALTLEGQSRATATAMSTPGVAALRAWAQGGRAPTDASLHVSATFDGLPLAVLRPFVAVPEDLRGALRGTASLDGSIDLPELVVDLALEHARLADLDIEDALLRVAPAPGGYELSASVVFLPMPPAPGAARLGAPKPQSRPSCALQPGDPAGGLTLTGFVPIRRDLLLTHPGLDLRLAGTGLPLAAAESFTHHLASTSGCLVVTGAVNGTLAQPAVNLALDLRDAAAYLPDLGIEVADTRIAARFDANRLVIDELSAQTRGPGGSQSFGTIVANGAIAVADGARGDVTATVKLDRAWILSRADRRARVSGSLEVGWIGDLLTTTGNLTLDDGYLHLNEKAFAGTRASRLDSDIVILRSVAPATPAPVPVAAPLLRFHPNISVDLARHARIDVTMPLQGGYGDLARSLSTVSVRTDLDGTLGVSSRGDTLRVIGQVTTEKGRAEVLGRPFEIDDGVLAFTGADYMAPILNLRATNRTEYGDIQVLIGGVPSAPTVSFTSDTISDDDILAVLVLGAPLADVGRTAGGGAGASAALGIVTSMLRDQVSGDLATTLRLDTLEVGDDMGSVGVALGRNLTLTTAYKWNVSDPARDNIFEVTLELALPKRWFLSMSTGDKGVSTGSAYRKWRF